MTSEKELNLIISNNNQEIGLNDTNEISSPKNAPQIRSIIETSPQINSKIIRARMLSPQNSKDKIDSMLEKMELNTKYFPSKESFLKKENSDKISYSPRASHSPIVNYYAGLDHSFYSPDTDFNFNNQGDVIFKFHSNNYLRQYANFNYSPGSFFNKQLNKSPDNNILKYNNINIDNNKNVGSLQERIENNINENCNTIKEKSSRNNSFNEEEETNQNQELYMLSFNSDDEEKDNENEEKKEEIKNIMSIPPFIPKNYNYNYPNNKNNNNYMPNKFDNYPKTFSSITHSNPKDNFYIQDDDNKIQIPYPYSNNIIDNYFYPKKDFYFNNNCQENNYNNYVMKNKNNNNENNNNKIKTITQQDMITTIISNNKKVKRIDPNLYLNESYEFLSHNIFQLSKDQAGCRFLQKKLEDEPEIAIKYFYPSILPYLIPLTKDSFGNYFIQKIFSYINSNQIKEILTLISNSILDIGSNSHGTRVIQYLISFLNQNDLSYYFFNIIKPYVIPLLKELNCTHIIQKFLNDFPNFQELIDDIIIVNCSSLAMHRHGCCVLQKFLESSKGEKREKLINYLINDCEKLITDQFGNYVIQSILLLNEVTFSNKIVEIIIKNPSFYSKHKYSSNVVEKSFDYCDENIKNKLIEILSNKEIICDLMLDPHGNYVIQKALSFAEKNVQDVMIQNLIDIIPDLKNVSFGERIINRLGTLYPQLSDIIYPNKKDNYNKKKYYKKKGNDNYNYYYKSNK